jgi:hypothetical protein
MPVKHVCFLSLTLLLGMAPGCATPGGVSLRPDGSPGPEECSEKAREVMRILGLRVSDGATVELDLNQAEDSPITLYDGPIESELETSLGFLPPPTRLYGRVWTGGPQVVIRYYEAHPPDREKFPICAVARLAGGQLKKLPGSKPGMALVEFSSAGVYIVDSFR